MAGLPEILVELDDGTGTFPHDITAFVRLQGTGIRIVGHGRTDELDSVGSTECNMILKNDDARFTLGSPTYDVAADQVIRVTYTVGATTSQRFTGLVYDWPNSWSSPTGRSSQVDLTAIDRFARLTGTKVDGTLYGNEILAARPFTYWPLTDATGADVAMEASGNGRPTLKVIGSGSALGFGATTGAVVDGQTCTEFAEGEYLRRPKIPSIDFSAITVEGVFAANNDTSTTLLSLTGELNVSPYTAGGSIQIGFSGAGFAQVTSDTGAGMPFTAFSQITYGDAEPHHFAITIDSANDEASLYLDGVLHQTRALTPYNTFSATTPAVVVGAGLDGSMSHVAVYDRVLDAATIASHASAALAGATADSADERLARLARYAGLADTDLDLEAGILAAVAVQTFDQTPLVDAMQAVTTAEGGVLFVAGDGRITFHNRHHRALTSTGTPAVELEIADVEPPRIRTSRRDYLKNYITASRPGGSQQLARDEASEDQYGQYPDPLGELLLTTDDEVKAVIRWRLASYRDPQPRIDSLRVDMLTLPDAIVEALLASELGDRITVSGLFPQAPFATADVLIEGWDDELTDESWFMTFYTAPAATEQAWILGDPVFSVLGQTTRLHY